MGCFWWHGVITFIQSWWVTSRILSGLGQPDGYSAITKIMTTSSNRAVGIFMGYGHVKTYPSTMSVRWHFMAHWLCLITQLEQAGYEEKLRHMKKVCYSNGSTFSHNRHAWAGYIIHTDKCKQELKKSNTWIFVCISG